MRGYFGVGIEGVSKAMNVGSLLRTAHAFGAGFMFTVAAAYATREGGKADTSAAEAQVPLYHFADVASLLLPLGCQLVGVEIRDDAIELPSFRHPRTAAYVFGRERGELTPAMVERCAFIVRVPTRFALNVGIAGAIVLYDRLISLGRFPRRPESPGGPCEPLPPPVFGPPRFRKRRPDAG
ncbi:MAG: RNA methyltransferase [Rhodospirillales bacterium]